MNSHGISQSALYSSSNILELETNFYDMQLPASVPDQGYIEIILNDSKNAISSNFKVNQDAATIQFIQLPQNMYRIVINEDPLNLEGTDEWSIKSVNDGFVIISNAHGHCLSVNDHELVLLKETDLKVNHLWTILPFSKLTPETKHINNRMSIGSISNLIGIDIYRALCKSIKTVHIDLFEACFMILLNFVIIEDIIRYINSLTHLQDHLLQIYQNISNKLIQILLNYYIYKTLNESQIVVELKQCTDELADIFIGKFTNDKLIATQYFNKAANAKIMTHFNI
eukprot:NODE_729_length_4379_cov_1.289486.p2 type:complete len:283 gc:universal NODE_729_length_4379_cov_1.289486:814-1662(+)